MQAVDEKHGCMTSVLMQEHGGRQRPVAYFPAKLDPVAAGLPGCLRAVAAAEKAVRASRVLAPHSVAIIHLEQKTSQLLVGSDTTLCSLICQMSLLNVGLF